VYTGVGGKVEIFGPGVLAANSNSEPPGTVSASAATLQATVEPEGAEVTGCVFEYGTEAGVFSQTAACEPGLPYVGSSPVAVSAQVSGLAAGTAYHYRLAVSGAKWKRLSDTTEFRTLGPTVSNATAEAHSSSAVVLGEVDPGGAATTYRVEYGTTTSYGSSTGAVELGAGEAPVPVSVKIAGLQPNTNYHLRFVAANSAATTTGSDVVFATLPLVTNESFSEVAPSSATVAADVEPGGIATTYRVEYGTTAGYGSSTHPISVGSADAPVAVKAQLGELQPDTLYHLRIAAENSTASESGSDVTFTTRPVGSSGLPDDRGYEMVTPAENQGAEVYAPTNAGYTTLDSVWTELPFEASADGSAVTYVGSPTSAGNGSEGVGAGNQFLARRAAGGGWEQTDIQPAGYASPRYWGFSSDLRQGVLGSSEPLAGGAPRGYQDLYVHDTVTGASRPLFSGMPPYRSPARFGSVRGATGQTESLGSHYAGASADFSQLLFETNDALTPEAEGGPGEFAEENNLYESVEGRLVSVNVLPEGGPMPNASFGTEIHSGAVDFSHAISSDGARVFWTDLNTNALYVHENGSKTKLIAENATYLTASADGSKVLYTKAGDMYEGQLETGITRDLTPNGEMQGILGASEDLEYIYFVAKAALAAGGNPGQVNLYLYHEGRTRYITTLGYQESAEFYQTGEAQPWQANLGQRTAEVTPSGHDLVFMSNRSLTGYDNLNRAESIAEHEVYVYDAESGALSCVSCDPTGEPPTVRDDLEKTGAGGFFPISGFPTFQPRVISEDGSRVFFESVEPILPQAQNGVVNVYEWERDGAGSCALGNGCLYLLSTGNSSTPSFFVDASASGGDVFLMTRSQLVPADENEYLDIYDARVGATQAPAAPRCTGTGCQGVQAAPPVFATPASVTFNGVGNFTPAPPRAVKSVAKPKKKQICVTKKTNGKSKGRMAAERVKVKPAACRVKKAAKRARNYKSERGGR
jgi:hypothetical protein